MFIILRQFGKRAISALTKLMISEDPLTLELTLKCIIGLLHHPLNRIAIGSSAAVRSVLIQCVPGSTKQIQKLSLKVSETLCEQPHFLCSGNILQEIPQSAFQYKQFYLSSLIIISIFNDRFSEINFVGIYIVAKI